MLNQMSLIVNKYHITLPDIWWHLITLHSITGHFMTSCDIQLHHTIISTHIRSHHSTSHHIKSLERAIQVLHLYLSDERRRQRLSALTNRCSTRFAHACDLMWCDVEWCDVWLRSVTMVINSQSITLPDIWSNLITFNSISWHFMTSCDIQIDHAIIENPDVE